MIKAQKPKPGTEAAKQIGCTCPVMDNSYGRGRYGDGDKYGWWISGNCPIHAEERK